MNRKVRVLSKNKKMDNMNLRKKIIVNKVVVLQTIIKLMKCQKILNLKILKQKNKMKKTKKN